jgi:Zn-finger protein
MQEHVPDITCPPHHWLIDSASGQERWACRKCGLVRQQERRWDAVQRLANSATWSRDEIALMEPWDEVEGGSVPRGAPLL